MADSVEDLKVENFIVQLGQERYPPPEPTSNNGNETQVGAQDGDETTTRAPTVALLRSNLVAVSQRFNLYFAAFQDKIHVYILRGMTTILSEPDAIIRPPISPSAGPGYMNLELPHAINHMMVAQFCSYEILLFACDDGDVLAYYTHLLAQGTKKIDDGTKAPDCSLRPFFHETVIKSAWGLAVHDKSRTIAVGSNARMVILFRFPSSIPTTPATSLSETLFNEFAPQETTPLMRSVLHIKQPIELGPDGHNVPSLAFEDGPDGLASHILAADINGNLWYIKLPDGLEKKRIPAPFPFMFYDEFGFDPNVMGWGVLSLPLSYFKMRPRTAALGISQQPSTTNPDEIQLAASSASSSSPAILRTFRNDVQLVHVDEAAVVGGGDYHLDLTSLAEVFKRERGRYRELENFRRLNMLAVVPELNLVAIGSQSGKVKVYTMWRLPDEDGAEIARVMIAKAAALPLQKDEMHRPVASLLGIAVAPVDRDQEENEQWILYSKRFRLFLHYTDHTILSYELSRPEKNEVGIF